MKIRIVSIVVIFTAALCAATGLRAQETVINRQEFESKHQAGVKLMLERTRRVTYVSESGSYNSRSITEIVPPDREHSINTNTDSQGITTTTETITIGNSRWMRRNDGSWMELTSNGSGSGSGNGNGGRLIERTEEGKRISGVKIDDETADLYQYIVVMRVGNGGIGESKTITTERNWFNKDGLLLKHEYTRENGEGKISYKSVSTYTYPASIKIEKPPVVTEKTVSN